MRRVQAAAPVALRRGKPIILRASAGDRRLHAEVANDPHDAFHQLDIVRETPLRIVQVVFKADAHMSAEEQRLQRRIELRNADRADIEYRPVRHQFDHLLQDFRRVRHRPLETAIGAEHEIDKIRRIVEAGLEAGVDVLQEVGGAEHLPFRLDALRLHGFSERAAARRRGVHQYLAAFEGGDDGGRVEGAHLGSSLHALDPLLPQDLPVTVRRLATMSPLMPPPVELLMMMSHFALMSSLMRR